MTCATCGLNAATNGAKRKRQVPRLNILFCDKLRYVARMYITFLSPHTSFGSVCCSVHQYLNIFTPQQPTLLRRLTLLSSDSLRSEAYRFPASFEYRFSLTQNGRPS